MKISRGQVWWCNFSGMGGETIKRRPAIVISNNKSNEYLNRVQVIPLTSNITKCYPGETLITLKGKQSKAMIDQIQTFDKIRLLDFFAETLPEDLEKVENVILLQLGIKTY